jgi:hypothetical protein
MFFSHHPKPAVDSRPAADLTFRAESAKRNSNAGGLAPPICFTVSYSLFEYLSIIGDFTLVAIREETGKDVDRVGPGARLLMALVVGPTFLYKKLRVGTCRFIIDSQGLTRLSRNSKIVLPWHEVHSVYALGKGYLVRKRSGAMPLPYRCFTVEERARFDRWARGATDVIALQPTST